MSAIIGKYQLIFTNQNKNGSIKKVADSENTNNFTLTLFLFGLTDIENLNEGIELVQYYENGGVYNHDEEKVKSETSILCRLNNTKYD